MKFRHWITAIVLLLLIALAIVGFLRTRELKPAGESEDAGKTPTKALEARKAPAASHTVVDQRPLQTAGRGGALATTRGGKGLARHAGDNGGHERELAFVH